MRQCVRDFTLTGGKLVLRVDGHSATLSFVENNEPPQHRTTASVTIRGDKVFLSACASLASLLPSSAADFTGKVSELLLQPIYRPHTPPSVLVALSQVVAGTPMTTYTGPT